MDEEQEILLPTFIGIGAPKAGTTWIASCIDEHPEAALSGVKETEFWKFADAATRLAEYSAHFTGTGNVKARGEFSVRYLNLPDVPKRIADIIPNTRLIVSLRNPVEQVQSWYWHLRRQGRMRDPQNSSRILSPNEAIDKLPHLLLDQGLYHLHLSHWWKFFDREQLLVVLYEDIKNNPVGVIQQVYKHIQVDANFIPPSCNARGSETRAGVSPKSRFHDRVYGLTYQSLNRVIYRPLRRLIGSRRAGQVNQMIGVRRVLEKLFFRRGYQPFDAATRQRVIDYYREDVERLEDALGRDLSQWSV
jgi:hypothetical protein